jgi:hypothetical protein
VNAAARRRFAGVHALGDALVACHRYGYKPPQFRSISTCPKKEI